MNKRKSLSKELSTTIELLKEKIILIENLKNHVNNDTINSNSLIESLDKNYISDKEWGKITMLFETLHNGYLNNLKNKYPKLTKSENKLAILLKLNYSNQAITEILKISYDGVIKAKQRFKKKTQA